MVYYRNPQNQQVYGYDPATQQDLIDQAIAAGWIYVPVWPLPPTDDELKAECQTTASGFLYETDWTTIPDVANPANNPYLTNQAEFIAYRNTIRKYAVNPVTNPVWPAIPTAQWNNS
jgi:hypothetical protein